MTETFETDTIHPDDVATIKKSLLFYRVMAYVVGTLLVVLVCVGVPLKYLGNDERVVLWTGVPHGWLYMILIALAGTVPFLSFVAEHYATKDVRRKLAAVGNPTLTSGNTPI